jgi:hypothetical protein
MRLNRRSRRRTLMCGARRGRWPRRQASSLRAMWRLPGHALAVLPDVTRHLRGEEGPARPRWGAEVDEGQGHQSIHRGGSSILDRCRMARSLDVVDLATELTFSVASSDPVVGLRAVAALRRLADQLKALQVERWFAALTTNYLQRSVHRSVAELTRGIKEWTDSWNNDPKPFIWTKSADEIFASMRKYLKPTVLAATCDKEH